MQQIKSLLGRWFLPRLVPLDSPSLQLEHPICVSRAVRDLLVARGVDIAHAKVIYGGTSVTEFDGIRPAQAPDAGTLRLVYIGRLEHMKGVHTVVQAMRSTENSVTLDIWGSGDPDYIAQLQTSIAAADLQARVRLLGAAPRSQVPQVLSRYDALVFSSEWEEPFARTVLEAMAAGLAVIGTTTGGTGELLVEDETGLTYAAGSAAQLSTQIRRLAADPALRRRLVASAGQKVRQYYTLERMVDELERELLAIANQPVLMAH
jgi:glycosyltransferase involved in cell wall biosynthesis